MQVKALARELHTQHFSSINPSDSLKTSELGRVVQDITAACQAHEQDMVSICNACVANLQNVVQELEGGATWEELLTSALTQLVVMLNDEKTLSVFEVQASNLVSALLSCLTMVTV